MWSIGNILSKRFLDEKILDLFSRALTEKIQKITYEILEKKQNFFRSHNFFKPQNFVKPENFDLPLFDTHFFNKKLF